MLNSSSFSFWYSCKKEKGLSFPLSPKYVICDPSASQKAASAEILRQVEAFFDSRDTALDTAVFRFILIPLRDSTAPLF